MRRVMDRDCRWRRGGWEDVEESREVEVGEGDGLRTAETG